MKFRPWLVVSLAVALAPPALNFAFASTPPQSGGTQAQQTAPQQPQQPQKKKAKKVWTDDDFPQRPAEAAPAPAAPGATPGAAGQQPARPGEAKAEETPQPEPESVESLEKELARLAKDRQSFEQQIEELRAKMRAEPDETRWGHHRENIDALEEFMRRNDEETAAVRIRLEQARKRKPTKPAQKRPTPPPPAEQPPPPQPE